MLSFKDGYETFVRVNGAQVGVDHGAEYISNIETEIEKLTNAINNPSRKLSDDIHSAKGYLAEWWHEGSFNIDAAVKGVKTRADAPDDNGIVDIFLNGDKYQVKYYKDGIASAEAQAKTVLQHFKEYCSKYRREHNGQEPTKTLEEYMKEHNFIDKNDPYYLGQGRLIPVDQLKNAHDWLRDKILKESNGGRPDQIKRYQEALDKLTDRLKSRDGAESIPLTEEESRELAKLAKEAGFDPADWGLTTEELVQFDYIMKQAFYAGLSAATISFILKVAPEVCGIIWKLIKNSQVNVEDFKRLGFAALEGSSQGFIRGTIAAAITTSVKAGAFGTTVKAMNPTIIGAIVAISLNTVQNACLMSFGKMSKSEFAEHCAQDLIVTTCAIGMGVAGGAIATAMFTPAAAIYGYMIGSFIGSVVGSFVYKGVYSCFMSFCVESGSIFFGLVDQNYELPVDVLKSMGAKVFEYEKFEPKRFEYQKFEPKRFEYQKFKPVKIDVKFLRRGVIGVSTIGYV